ncbi:MAG: calcium-binding protein [Inquilinus sp.]|uniref:calcium-binding protein n=1 Tax=Inquilinus sp. TaxID=1932117 RepID=UPI003F3100D6
MANYLFSVDGEETAEVGKRETAFVYNLDFFDTTDKVTGAPKGYPSTLAFHIGGDIDLDLTGYAGIQGFSTLTAQSAIGGVHLTIGADFYNGLNGGISAESLSNLPVILDASSSTYSPDYMRALSDGRNVLIGAAGDDDLRGGGGGDKLHGGAGGDGLSGGAGSDVLDGGAGADYLYGGAGSDVLEGGADADRLDGGDGGGVEGVGVDIADYSNGSTGVVVNLFAGTASGGDAQGDTLFGIENLSGSQGNDSLVGDSGRNGLQGGNGNDVLIGGRGDDDLTGGAGADRFLYIDAVQSPVGDGADRIADFSHAQGDKIELWLIDADTTIAGNQAFSFIGTALYSGVAGQLRYSLTGYGTIVAGDIDGDGTSDFHIRVSGHLTLVASDFVL